MIRNVDKVNLNGQVEMYIEVSTRMMRGMDMEK